jgi:hypothetical protein
MTKHKSTEELYKFIYTLSLPWALGGGGVKATPCRFTPGRQPECQLLRKVGRAQCQKGQAWRRENLFPSPE